MFRAILADLVLSSRERLFLQLGPQPLLRRRNLQSSRPRAVTSFTWSVKAADTGEPVADTEWVFWEWDDPLIYNFELKVTDNGHLDSDPTVGTITLKYPYVRAMTTAKITQTAAGGSYAPAAKAIYGRISDHGGPITLGSTFIDQLADGRILYDGNGNTNTGGETEGAEQSGQATKVIPAAENTFFTRDGYTFSGWNTAADGAGDQIQPGDDVVFSKGDRTLYAQ